MNSRGYLVKSLVVVILGTLCTTWLVGLIPIHRLPVHGMWIGISYHCVSALSSLMLIRIFCPGVFARFRFGISRQKMMAGGAVLALLLAPELLHISFMHNSMSRIFQGVIFTLWIGIDEEIFSRGFIFGSLEHYGVGVAAAISSVHFGLLHLGNYAWGGQSRAYTASQIVSAAAFGYLCAGLMIYTGTIWVPIVLHGLSDLPMVLQSSAQYTQQVTGSADWIGVIASAIFYVGIGWLLIHASKSEGFEKLQSVAFKFGLLEQKST